MKQSTLIITATMILAVSLLSLLVPLSLSLSKEHVNAQGLMSTFCNAVRQGLASGPQASICNQQQPQTSTSTSANQGFPCTPTFNTFGCTSVPSNNYPPPRILSHSSYTNNITGTLHIVGEVVNESPVTAKFVEIIATLYNAYNQVIGTQFTYTQPPDLAPGQRAPFDILVLSGGIPLNQVRTYTLSVSTS